MGHDGRPIDRQGRRLAKLLRPALSGHAFAIVLVSPLKRNTAGVVAEILSSEVQRT